MDAADSKLARESENTADDVIDGQDAPKPRLAFDDIHHTYGTLAALRGVSLDVAPGEILCLLGHSGCGKTTLLRIGAGVERQTSGQILIDGQVVSGPALFAPPEQRGVGLMFQDYALFPHLTILKNVMFGLASKPTGEAKDMAMAALERVRLTSLAQNYPHALSGGEQQRVALARAIAPQPRVLLMDEPFSGLDKRLRDSVRDETLAVLRETNATCIIVTHDPEEAMSMSDRIALMRSGQLHQVGTPHDLYFKPVDMFAAQFFSELNIATCRTADGQAEFALGVIAVPEFPEGTDVEIGIRPTGILVGSPEFGHGGTVNAARFLGDVDHLTIDPDGLGGMLQARTVDIGRFAPGDRVGIHLDPRHVVVFPKTA